MRDLIDRQTIIEQIDEIINGNASAKAWAISYAVKTAPTVTRISDERYYRLIGKPIKQ